MNPGWYPDPYTNGMLRWWDGATWTAFTAPMGMPPGGFYAADPQADLDGEMLAARRAMVTVIVSAVLGAGLRPRSHSAGRFATATSAQRRRRPRCWSAS